MHILIVRNNSNPKALDASLLLMAYLNTQGIAYIVLDVAMLEDEWRKAHADASYAQHINLAVVLGGDGTILRTARLLGTSGVPLLGINFGHLGFLANSSEDGVVSIVSEALAGEVLQERRTNMRIDVILDGETDPFDCKLEAGKDLDTPDTLAISNITADKEGFRSFFALNEMAITRGTMGRIIDFSLDISDAHVANMRGDGMVIATATGSTAYALSAGGPLVAPSFMGLVVVPLAPHTIQSRAILTGENDIVCIELADTLASREATLFVDGDLISFDKPIRRIYIRRGEAPTVLLRYSGHNFYEHAAETFF